MKKFYRLNSKVNFLQIQPNQSPPLKMTVYMSIMTFLATFIVKDDMHNACFTLTFKGWNVALLVVKNIFICQNIVIDFFFSNNIVIDIFSILNDGCRKHRY